LNQLNNTSGDRHQKGIIASTRYLEKLASQDQGFPQGRTI
jgi:hypothetical protein